MTLDGATSSLQFSDKSGYLQKMGYFFGCEYSFENAGRNSAKKVTFPLKLFWMKYSCNLSQDALAMSKFLICFETFVMYYVENELKISKMFPQKSLIEKGLGFVVFSTAAFVKPSTSQKIFSECRVDLF